MVGYYFSNFTTYVNLRSEAEFRSLHYDVRMNMADGATNGVFYVTIETMDIGEVFEKIADTV